MRHDQIDTLVAAHHGEIYRYLLVVTGQVTDAHDLSQETFVQALRAPTSRAPVAGARPWLFAIATELSRRRGRRRVTKDGQWRHPMAMAMMRLPAEQRIALALRRLHGFDHQQIGRVLGCSRRGVRDHVVQAFRNLARIPSMRSAPRADALETTA